MGNAALHFSYGHIPGLMSRSKKSLMINVSPNNEMKSEAFPPSSRLSQESLLRRASKGGIRSSLATPQRVDRVIEITNNQNSEVSGISVLATHVLRVIYEEAFDVDHCGRVSKDQFLFTLHNRPDVIPFLLSSLEEHQSEGSITAEEMFAELEKANHHSFITFNEFLAYFAPPKKFIEGCMAGTNLDYKSLCSNAHWSYADPMTGPSRWHTLSEKNKIAAEGKQQSPVNILSFKVAQYAPPSSPRKAAVSIEYEEKKLDAITITNTGYTIQVGWSPGNIVVQGTSYSLSQFHFHSPAEHTIDNVQVALEMHLVHVSQESQLAVIGILYKVGPSENSFLKQFWEEMPLEPSEHLPLTCDLNPGLLELTDEKGNILPHYSYEGSLTTPPCSEGVQWILMEAVQECSVEQLEKFQEAINYQRNFRPTQPLHGREIKLCKCSSNCVSTSGSLSS